MTIPVIDRFLSIDEIIFDNENSTLFAYFELTLCRKQILQKRISKNEEFTHGGEKQNNGLPQIIIQFKTLAETLVKKRKRYCCGNFKRQYFNL